jgi:hypothetical protein
VAALIFATAALASCDDNPHSQMNAYVSFKKSDFPTVHGADLVIAFTVNGARDLVDDEGPTCFAATSGDVVEKQLATGFEGCVAHVQVIATLSTTTTCGDAAPAGIEIGQGEVDTAPPCTSGVSDLFGTDTVNVAVVPSAP